jgi:dCTP deaminase
MPETGAYVISQLRVGFNLHGTHGAIVSTLSAQTILRRHCSGDVIFEPFYLRGFFEGRSFGLSSCGYDVRLKQDIWLWPLWGRRGSIKERIRMPVDLRGKVEDKSTNARLFVTVQNTNIEPGWAGWLTVELTRHLPWPIRLKAGTPIAQIVLQMLDEPTMLPYRGKYQDQEDEPVAARLQADPHRIPVLTVTEAP